MQLVKKPHVNEPARLTFKAQCLRLSARDLGLLVHSLAAQLHGLGIVTPALGTPVQTKLSNAN